MILVFLIRYNLAKGSDRLGFHPPVILDCALFAIGSCADLHDFFFMTNKSEEKQLRPHVTGAYEPLSSVAGIKLTSSDCICFGPLCRHSAELARSRGLAYYILGCGAERSFPMPQLSHAAAFPCPAIIKTF